MNNKPTTVDMTKGSIYRVIINFALPVLLSQIFQQLYNTADALIVGRFLGTEALAAVSSSGTLIFLLTSFFIGTSMGGGVVISRYFGAGDENRVSLAVHTSIALGIVSSVLLTIVGVLFTPVFLGWMNTDPDVMPLATEYFRFYFSGTVAMVMYNTCKGIMNAVGDSKRPLYYLIFSSFLNIALDLIFIGVFKFGVWAAAAATVLSQGVSFILCLVHLMKKGNVFTVDLRKIRFHKETLREVIKYGLPAGVQNSVIGLANVIVQSQINTFGKLAMAAYGAHAKIEGFAFLPITSFSMSLATFTSQNLGAKEYDRVKKGSRFGIISAVLLAELIGIICFITAPLLISLFDSTPQVIEFGVRQAHTAALFYFLLSYSNVMAAVLRGAGKAFVPMTVMLAVWCVLRVAYIAVVMTVTGEIGYIYAAYPITWTISSIIYLIYYCRSDWIHGFEKKHS